MQDSLNVFENPVDSVRVAAQDITSEVITDKLDFLESVWALRHLLEPLYLLLVILSYYIVVKRLPFIPTNSTGRRNMAMFVLAIAWALFMVYTQGAPWLNVLVSGLGTFAFYELIGKTLFKFAEQKLGLKLPSWYVDEVQEEKRNDIASVDKLRKPE